MAQLVTITRGGYGVAKANFADVKVFDWSPELRTRKRMKIRKLDHYNLWSFKREETLKFYCEVLGLEDGAHLRPPSSSPGTWLLVDGHPAVHINFTEDNGNASTGIIDHIAFDASDAAEFEKSFTQHEIAFKKVDRPEIGLTQLFVTDPNGVKIELNIRA